MADPENQQKLDKQKLLIETIKWFIASVLIVVVTLIVDSNFKKRDLMLKELDQYDKFVDLLIANNNTIGAQYKLAGFYDKFSISKDIKERWDIYLVELKKEYDEYNEYLANTNAQIDNLESKQTKTDKDIVKLDSLKNKKEVLQKILSSDIKVPSKTQYVSTENTNTNTKLNEKDFQVLKTINDDKMKKMDLKEIKPEKPENNKEQPKKK
jgi:hypothetical protein